MEKWSNISEIEVKSYTVVVAIPHRWLRQVVERIFSAARVECICVENIDELYQSINRDTGLTIVDVFSYSQYYLDIFTQLKQRNSGLSIVALVSARNTEYQYQLTTAGASAIVIMENADEELIPALVQVLRDREFNDAVARLIENQKQFVTLIKDEVNLMGKEDDNIFGKRFGRRSFLKGSAAAAAMAGVAVASPGNTVMKALAAGEENATSSSGEEIFYGFCRGACNGGCRLKITTRDDKVVKTTMGEFPDPRYNRICSKGLSHPQRMYSQDRLKYPMRRVGERGSGEWEQISWDEAIEEICSKWEKYREEIGNNSIAFLGGTGNMSRSPVYMDALKLLLGATTLLHGYDNAYFYGLPNVTGYGSFLSTANEIADIENAKCLILWASNSAVAHPHNTVFINNAKKKGCKVIAIDPCYTPTVAKYADMHVPIKPGTDAALAMAMMNVVIKDGLIDERFLKIRSVAPFLVKENDGKFLRADDQAGEMTAKSFDPSDVPELSKEDAATLLVMAKDGTVGLASEVTDPVIHGSFKVNGTKVTTAYDLLLKRIAEWTPEKAAELCDISVETIYEIAHLYADGPSTIYAGYGAEHYVNGHYAYFAMGALAIITGNMAKKGAGVGNNIGILSAQLNKASDYAAKHPTGLKPGPKLNAPHLNMILKEGKCGNRTVDLKSLIVYCCNPVTNIAGKSAWLEAMDMLEFIVVVELTMTDTARYADLVLPAAYPFEQEDFQCDTVQYPYVVLQEKVMDPLYECKDDFDIANLIGERMGLDNHLCKSKEEFLKFCLDNDNCKKLNLTWERLKKEKVVRFYPKNPLIQWEDGDFSTPTGRAQFYLETVIPNYEYASGYDVEKERLPHWEPPHEAWSENPLFGKYPLIFAAQRSRFRTHTMFGHTPWLVELSPEPIVKMNTGDAKDRGIKNGDTVKVFNERGYVILKAVINPGQRPGMINIPRGWQGDQFIEGHNSDLISETTNPVCVNNNWNDSLVEIEKL